MLANYIQYENEDCVTIGMWGYSMPNKYAISIGDSYYLRIIMVNILIITCFTAFFTIGLIN